MFKLTSEKEILTPSLVDCKVKIIELHFEVSSFRHIYCRLKYKLTPYSIEGQAVVQLAEALRYKPEGRGFNSRGCQWNFSLTYSFRSRYGPGIDSASNRNEYQVYFLGVKAAGA